MTPSCFLVPFFLPHFSSMPPPFYIIINWQSVASTTPWTKFSPATSSNHTQTSTMSKRQWCDHKQTLLCSCSSSSRSFRFLFVDAADGLWHPSALDSYVLLHSNRCKVLVGCWMWFLWCVRGLFACPDAHNAGRSNKGPFCLQLVLDVVVYKSLKIQRQPWWQCGSDMRTLANAISWLSHDVWGDVQHCIKKGCNTCLSTHRKAYFPAVIASFLTIREECYSLLKVSWV